MEEMNDLEVARHVFWTKRYEVRFMYQRFDLNEDRMHYGIEMLNYETLLIPNKMSVVASDAEKTIEKLAEANGWVRVRIISINLMDYDPAFPEYE